MFGLSTGIVSQMQNGIYKIVAVNSPLGLELGAETCCQDTYCMEVIETQTSITFTEVGKIRVDGGASRVSQSGARVFYRHSCCS